ncbi:MAG: hypothetical protein COB36_13345 [Alphaproteobacteria bacterium]|nr:MAG: hypothetical protein COB36_13345 [Alphaproteobacteria bacterium]
MVCKFNIKKGGLTATVTICLTIAMQALAAPITFNTALPVSDEEFIVRQQIHYSKASDNLGSISRDVKVWKSITAVGYGVTDKFAVFGVMPIINKDMQIGSVKREVSGLADMKLFGRYQIYRKDGPGTTTRIAPFLGVNLPMGKTGKTSDGSTDYFGGLILTRASTNWNVDAQLKYTANGKYSGFARGNEASLDASLQYRINTHNANVNISGYLFTVLETSLVYADENKIGSIIDLNTGGTTAFIAPGLQYATKRWIGEAAVKIPVVKDLNGTALQPGITIITSIRVNF